MVGLDAEFFRRRARPVAPRHLVAERLGPGDVPCVRGDEEELAGREPETVGAERVHARIGFVGLHGVDREHVLQVRREAARRDGIFREERFGPFSKRATQPSFDWNREAHLRPVDDLPRHAPVEHLAQDPFTDGATQLELAWQPPREFDDAVIEQRGTDFEAHGHAGAINLRELGIYEGRDELVSKHALQNLELAIQSNDFKRGWRLFEIATSDKLDKDRFRRDMGGLVEAYQDVARRLGIMVGNEPNMPRGPVLVQ